MAEVVIKIKRDGSVEVEGQGIKGSACSIHTGPFLQALGKVIASRPTGEMFEESNALTQAQENR